MKVGDFNGRNRTGVAVLDLQLRNEMDTNFCWIRPNCFFVKSGLHKLLDPVLQLKIGPGSDNVAAKTTKITNCLDPLGRKSIMGLSDTGEFDALSSFSPFNF